MAEPITEPITEPSLRLLTWNVRDMLGDPLAVHRVIRAAEPDVVCLQESPRWPGSRFRLRRIARATGLRFVAGGRASAGTSVFVGERVVPVSAQAVRLPTPGWRTRPRGVVLVSAGMADEPAAPALTVACVHLGLSAPERAEHLAIIEGHLDPQARLAVAGDLNEGPDGESWKRLSAIVQDPAPDAGPTFPSWKLRRRIDAVLVGAGVEVLEYDRWTPDPRDLQLASDHRPVLAVLSVHSQDAHS